MFVFWLVGKIELINYLFEMGFGPLGTSCALSLKILFCHFSPRRRFFGSTPRETWMSSLTLSLLLVVVAVVSVVVSTFGDELLLLLLVAVGSAMEEDKVVKCDDDDRKRKKMRVLMKERNNAASPAMQFK